VMPGGAYAGGGAVGDYFSGNATPAVLRALAAGPSYGEGQISPPRRPYTGESYDPRSTEEVDDFGSVLQQRRIPTTAPVEDSGQDWPTYSVQSFPGGRIESYSTRTRTMALPHEIEPAPKVGMGTQLLPQDEEPFQAWYAGVARANRLDPNVDAPEHHYDMRGAYAAGHRGVLSAEDNRLHFPSAYKSYDHPNRFVDTGNGSLVNTSLTQSAHKNGQRLSRFPVARERRCGNQQIAALRVLRIGLAIRTRFCPVEVGSPCCCAGMVALGREHV